MVFLAHLSDLGMDMTFMHTPECLQMDIHTHLSSVLLDGPRRNSAEVCLSVAVTITFTRNGITLLGWGMLATKKGFYLSSSFSTSIGNALFEHGVLNEVDCTLTDCQRISNQSNSLGDCSRFRNCPLDVRNKMSIDIIFNWDKHWMVSCLRFYAAATPTHNDGQSDLLVFASAVGTKNHRSK